MLLLLLLVGALSADVGLAVATVEPGASAGATTGTTAGASGSPDQPSPPVAAGSPTLAQLVGQKLMVAMSGTTPSADLLGRIERGEVGGVILFSFNISTAEQLAGADEEAGARRRRPAASHRS